MQKARLIRAPGTEDCPWGQVNPILKDRLIQLLSEGKIYQAEAERIAGVTWGTVRDWMKVRGIDVKKARNKYLEELFND